MVQQSGILRKGIEEHFASSINDSLLLRKLEISPWTQQYLANMLHSFVRAEQLFAREGIEGKFQLEPVTYQYFHALTEQGITRRLRLKKVADECLFLTGYFYDHINSAGNGQTQFHHDVGTSAYIHLAQGNTNAAYNAHLVGLYHELAANFTVLSAVIGDLHLPELNHVQNVLRLYERWQKTQDPRQYEALVGCGFLKRDKVSSIN